MMKRNDRFIVPRNSINFELANYQLTTSQSDDESEDLIGSPAYKKILKKRIINVDKKILSNGVTEDPTNPWPVRMRQCKALKVDKVFDIPHFDSCFYFNLLDINVSNDIATWGKNCILIGNISEKKQPSQIPMPYAVTTIRWSPDCEWLIIGFLPGNLEIYNLNTEKCQNVFFPSLKTALYNNHFVTDAQWHPRKNNIIWGCDNGMVKTRKNIFNKPTEANYIKKKHHVGPVLRIRYSPTASHFCTCGASGKVTVWKSEILEVVFERKHEKSVKAIAWHPWRTNLLAIGGGMERGGIELWDFHAKTMIFQYNCDAKYPVVDVEFSRKTGEIIFSENIMNVCESNINVLGSGGKIVDAYRVNHMVVYLLFNPAGDKLVTASHEEQFSVHSFEPSNLPEPITPSINRSLLDLAAQIR